MSRRFTQHEGVKLYLEKLVKSNIYLYKIAFWIKILFLEKFFYEQDLKGIDYLKIKNQNCIDIGANVGQTIEFLRKRFQTIYAFEPYYKNYNFLKLRYKSIKSIRLFNFALSNKSGKRLLYIPIVNNVELHQSASFYKQECYKTLKEFLKVKKEKIRFKKSYVIFKKMNTFKFRNISLIKIDAEGHEYEILSGMKKYLKKDLVIVLEQSQRSFNKASKILRHYGFKAYKFSKDKFSINTKGALNVYFIKNKKKFL